MAHKFQMHIIMYHPMLDDIFITESKHVDQSYVKQ